MPLRVLGVLLLSGLLTALVQAAQPPDEAAWRLFVQLNVEAATRAGRPDAPAAWERWPTANQVFLAGGADPGAWQDAALALAADLRFETTALKDLPNARHIVGGRMVALDDALGSQRRLTEIRFNRVSFEYIRQRQLYALPSQVAAAQSRGGVDFPYGAVHVKARWRPIQASERARYHTVSVRLPDGSVRLYGLTALHLASKQLPKWLWATFEQADNATTGEGWQLPSRDRFACAGRKEDCNDIPHGLRLEATVWSHYRLRGTMTRFVDADGRPERLANSDLESGFQGSSSCITCHARSAVGARGHEALRPAVLQDTTDGPQARRGFIGLPQPQWFSVAGTPMPLSRLDFVWSLLKAQGDLP